MLVAIRAILRMDQPMNSIYGTCEVYLPTILKTFVQDIEKAATNYKEEKSLSATKSRWLPLQFGCNGFTLYHFIQKRTSPHSKNRIRACPPFSMSL